MKKAGALTLLETAAVLSALEGRVITHGQVRAILVVDTRGRAMAPRQPWETRLYTAEDVALIRLVLRLRAQGVSPIVARIVVACLRDELIAAWRRRRAQAMAVVGLRGVLVPVHSHRPAGVIAWQPLRDIWSGIESAICAMRATTPDGWQWRPQPAAAPITADLR